MKQSELSITVVIVVAAITLLNLVQAASLQDFGSITIAIVGAGLIAAYLFTRKLYPNLFYAWILLQIPIITTNGFAYLPSSEPISIAIGLTLSSFVFKINIIPLFLFGFYQYVVSIAHIGATFEIKELKNNENTLLKHFLPNRLIAVGTKKFGNDKKTWLKFDLLETFEVRDEKITSIYLAPKAAGSYNRKKFIPCFVKLGTERKEYAVKDWVLAKKSN